MSKIPKSELNKIKDTLEEFVYGDGELTREQLSQIITTLSENLTDACMMGGDKYDTY